MQELEYSPLFWPVKIKGKSIYVLDEKALPQKLTYLKLTNYKEVCSVIKEMRTRGVGQVLLVFYTFLMVIRQTRDKKNLYTELQKVSLALQGTRPTLPYSLLTEMVLKWALEDERSLENQILEFLKRLKEIRIHQAEEASRLIQNNDTILTHCNLSGLLPLIGKFCKQRQKKIRFFVTETRPYLQGARLTAWELQNQGFEVTIVADSTVAYIMSEGMIDKVIVGADQLARNGDIANKIGTYQIAILANYFRIPFYVVCPPPASARTGKEIPIEIRPDKELLTYQGMRFAPKNVKGFYPAFDITPYHLITRHIHFEL